MSSGFRAGFPDLSIDVHVWNADPARRFVLINGQRYGEGDRLSSGPRIIEIATSGIVFEHQGQTTLLPLN